LPQRSDLSLCRRIGLGIPHDHANALHALGLLTPVPQLAMSLPRRR